MLGIVWDRRFLYHWPSEWWSSVRHYRWRPWLDVEHHRRHVESYSPWHYSCGIELECREILGTSRALLCYDESDWHSQGFEIPTRNCRWKWENLCATSSADYATSRPKTCRAYGEKQKTGFFSRLLRCGIVFTHHLTSGKKYSLWWDG